MIFFCPFIRGLKCSIHFENRVPIFGSLQSPPPLRFAIFLFDLFYVNLSRPVPVVLYLLCVTNLKERQKISLSSLSLNTSKARIWHALKRKRKHHDLSCFAKTHCSLARQFVSSQQAATQIVWRKLFYKDEQKQQNIWLRGEHCFIICRNHHKPVFFFNTHWISTYCKLKKQVTRIQFSSTSTWCLKNLTKR